MKAQFRASQLGVQIALAFLWIYRNCISGWKPCCCRFSPCCSQYARTALLRFGFWRGTGLALRRLLRCHPFYRGCLVDPVPPLTSPGNKRSTPIPQPHCR